MIPISYFLYLSAILFVLGLAGVLTRRNLILILISMELMLNAVILAFVAFSNQLAVPDGQIFALLIMVTASVQLMLGLILVKAIYNRKSTLNIDEFKMIGH